MIYALYNYPKEFVSLILGNSWSEWKYQLWNRIHLKKRDIWLFPVSILTREFRVCACVLVCVCVCVHCPIKTYLFRFIQWKIFLNENRMSVYSIISITNVPHARLLCLILILKSALKSKEPKYSKQYWTVRNRNFWTICERPFMEW